MTDKTVKINVDSTEAGKVQARLRQDAEQLAREMIKSSRQYSTSAKEVIKDIESQIRAIEKRNKLDFEFQKVRLESLRSSGAISANQYASQKSTAGIGARQDELQIKLLRELIDTIKQTSKEEIREDRRSVERKISGSKGVNRLGVSGDELNSLKESIQQDLISDLNSSESTQKRGFNAGRYYGNISAYGGAAQNGNIEGMGGMAAQGLMRAGAGMGGTAMAATGIGAVIIGAMMALWAGDKKLYSETRGYNIATQSGSNISRARSRFEGGEYQEMGMKTHEAMNLYGSMLKASGGHLKEGAGALALTAITRSREVSPDLLNQTIGLQRYSNTSSTDKIVYSFEQAIKEAFPTDFKRKLVQLPEMMGVYNSLAQQMLQTTGAVDSSAISEFINGISIGFGVEGQNLQRYAGGIKKGMSSSGNTFIRKMQFAAIREAYGDKSYQESLEILERPTQHREYMSKMYEKMKRQGLPVFRTWVHDAMGLGYTEAGKMFDSSSFKEAMAVADHTGSKTAPSQAAIMNNYLKDAQQFYSKAEQWEEKLSEFIVKFMTFFGVNTFEDGVSGGIKKAATAATGIPGTGFIAQQMYNAKIFNSK